MSNVVPFRPAQETDDGAIDTVSGPARCLVCQHEWIAVAPAGTSSLECPCCHTERATFTQFISPINQRLWICDCSGWLFAITGTGFVCVSCGVASTMDGKRIDP